MGSYCTDCLKKYFTNSDEIIFQKVYRDWDGADEYGPKAFLFDFLVIYKKNNDYFYRFFYREDWRNGEKEPFYPCSLAKEDFNRNLSEIFRNRGIDISNDFNFEIIKSFWSSAKKMVPENIEKEHIVSLTHNFILYLKV